MSEWKETTLSDMADIVPGFAFKGEYFGDTGTVAIKIKDIIPPRIDLHSAQRVDISHYSLKKLEKYRLYKGDYVVAMTGATIGKVGRLMDEDDVYINQRVAKIAPKNQVDRDFVYYCLVDSDFGDFVQNNIDSHSAQENISGTSIGRYPINSPPLPEQKAIASVLSSLDDKIDILHRQNKTLEAMAEALFRQWFVEEVGEDWEKKSLYDCINLIGGGTPKTSVDEYWNGDICWISAKDITPNHKGVICSTEKKITTEGLNSSSTRMLPRFSTIISARGTVGKYALLLDDMAFSQSNYGIIPKYKKCYFFTYMLVANVVDDLVGAAYGSVFDTITTKTFQEQYVTVPLEKEIIDFEKEISPLFLKVLNNSKQIRTLEQLRDTLLPKLMSGEVRVAC